MGDAHCIGQRVPLAEVIGLARAGFEARPLDAFTAPGDRFQLAMVVSARSQEGPPIDSADAGLAALIQDAIDRWGAVAAPGVEPVTVANDSIDDHSPPPELARRLPAVCDHHRTDND